MRISDWSSDVCSSDLVHEAPDVLVGRHVVVHGGEHRPGGVDQVGRLSLSLGHPDADGLHRARVGWRRSRPSARDVAGEGRSEEHTSELQSLMRISYAVFCLKKKKKQST